MLNDPVEQFNNRVIEYIQKEYDIDILSKLDIPEYADILYVILEIHRIHHITIPETSINIVNFILDRKVPTC
jgi:hypothetical protein